METSFYQSGSTRSPQLTKVLASRLKDRQSNSPVPKLNTSAYSTASASTSDLMLYPASQTIGDSLTALASSTASQLEDIWDEVGYTPEERAGQISELLNDMRRRCDEKISEEQGVAEQFRQAIADAKEEREMTSAALKLDLDPSFLENMEDQSLTDQLTTLELTLENIRAAANAAKEDLVQSQTKLINMHDALGSKLSKEWEDTTSDLTETRRQAFHCQVLEMEEIIQTRTKAIVQLLLDCQHLLNELDMVPNNARDDNDSSTIVDDEDALKQKALDVQIMGSLICREDDTFTLQSNLESPTNTGISAVVLDKLTKRLADLSQEKRRRKKYLGELGLAIASLWEKLRIPDDVQRAFTQSVNGLGMETIEKGEQELQRLTDMKAEMMGKLILEAREKIQCLCTETGSSYDRLKSFDSGKITDEALFTDDVLAEHEEQIHILQGKADQMRPLFKFIERREEIIKERMEYEELQKDPERLQQRGAALTKQLMKEEKMSKRIRKDLPKYTDVLNKRINEWEAEHEEKFMFRGESYLETMERQEKEWKAYKDHEMQMKLRKKQQGMAKENHAKNNIYFQPLPGKKKPMQARSTSRSGSRTRPLSESTSRQNEQRNPSRSRANMTGTSSNRRTTHETC